MGGDDVNEDTRTWLEYCKKATPITQARYDALRSFWRTLGGSFHGPLVEHGVMAEHKLLPILAELVKARVAAIAGQP